MKKSGVLCVIYMIKTSSFFKKEFGGENVFHLSSRLYYVDKREKVLIKVT